MVKTSIFSTEKCLPPARTTCSKSLLNVAYFGGSVKPPETAASELFSFMANSDLSTDPVFLPNAGPP